ncbi:hypothetical protein ERJ75_001030900 [Trypanosoma vivax]|nr:hypothetical protein TRVL_09748 [Trypanosoma vivax]KAH8611717.1 hypothetical protein ERJ75_001030900 [Trypanosoma vivax]
MSIMRRFGEFKKKRGLEMSEGRVPPFVVSLKLAKSGAVQRERTLLFPMAAKRAPAQMLPSGLRRGAAGNSTRQARSMMRWGRSRVAIRLARVTAGRCDEIVLLQKQGFIDHPGDRNALVVDWGALPKAFGADPRRTARCVATTAAGATTVRKEVAKMADGERPEALGTRAVGKILRPYGVAADSVERGALAQATAAAIKRNLDPRIATQLGKRAGPPELLGSVWSAGSPFRATPRS